MSRLVVYAEDDATPLAEYHAHQDIARVLDGIGVRFEAWQASQPLGEDASETEVLEAYRAPVERLMAEYGFQSVDVISLFPDHPGRETLREKFLREHTHSDFEVRFFVAGRGLFYIHEAGKVHAVTCERGDLISVPAGARHWFDMGPRPRFQCIRLFTHPDGWVAQYTGDGIAGRYPLLEG